MTCSQQMSAAVKLEIVVIHLINVRSFQNLMKFFLRFLVRTSYQVKNKTESLLYWYLGFAYTPRFDVTMLTFQQLESEREGSERRFLQKLTLFFVSG